MQLTTANDISIVLSGGTTNINVDNSIGGDPSSSPITNNTLNNLFSDVTSEQTSSGHEDYRCVYIFNDGQTTIYSVKVLIKSNSIGDTIQLGISKSNESQRITINGGEITGGDFTLSYKTFNFVVSYNSDLSIWGESIQSGLRNLMDSSGDLIFDSPTVIAQVAGLNVFIFDIYFSGLDSSKNLDKLQVVNNSLMSSSSINILVSTPSEGSPINTIASEINVSTTPPGGVLFSGSSVNLPMLKPNDGFPLWFKRTIPAGTLAQQNDGFKLAITAESLKP